MSAITSVKTSARRSTLDEAVNIKYLKRFITDNTARPKDRTVTITRMEKIAVVGAGPAGLTAARQLALRGYHVTVFEELPEPGGYASLRDSGIPFAASGP